MIDKMDLWKKALSVRKQLGEDAYSPVDVFSLSHTIDKLTIVHYPMSENLSGICIKGTGSNVIAVNSSMTLGRQRFSLAHELFHLFFGDNDLTAICSKKIGTGSNEEIKADEFASFFLMPPDALSDLISQIKKSSTDRLSINDIVRIEQYFQVSRQALLYRLIEDNEITLRETESMRNNIILSAINLGYEDTLYRPTPKEKQYGTYGFYILQADRALNKGLISNGKYEELLLSAYRADLVFGDMTEGGEVFD